MTTDIEGILREAGELLVERFRGNMEHSEKERFDLVTATDAEIEHLLVAHLKALHPDDAFLGEESGELSGMSGDRWLIDPIDGTTDFIMGKPYFAISIARESGGRIVEGHVYNPVSNEMYSAIAGEGKACLNGEAIHVSRTSSIGESLVVFGFSARMSSIRKYHDEWTAVFEGCRKAVGWTTPALTLCNVARGRIDAFIDFGASSVGQAAASFILEQAGGALLNYDLTAYDHRISGVIGATPTLLPELLKTREG